MKRKSESGQIALVIILVMTVVGALAVSIASRSTTGSAVQQVDITSGKALDTAQSGLEMLLNNPSAPALSGSVQSEGSGEATYEVTRSSLGTSSIVSQSEVRPGETIEINLVNAPNTITGVNIYWNPGATGNYPAIFGTLIKTTGFVDFAFDNTGTNGFTLVNSGNNMLNGVNYAFRQTVVVDAATTSIRLTPLGYGAFFGFSADPPGASFPEYGFVIRSIGKVTEGAQVIQRGIEYTQTSTSNLPSVFDYALFSLGSIVQ